MPQKERETLGQRIFRLREAAGLSQQQAADASGVPLATWYNWERDRRMPSGINVREIAKALKVTTDTLLDGVPDLDEARGLIKPRPLGRPRKPRPAADP